MAKIRTVSVNVHVGLGIFAGVFPWLFARIPFIHVVFVQEASRPPARRALLRAFPSKKWYRVGPGDETSDPLVGTYLFLRRRRFTLIGRFNEPISKARPPVKGKMPFPQRNLVSVIAVDKKTSRPLIATSVHNWHIVGRSLGDGTAVSRGHARQTRAVAEFHEEHWIDGAVSAASGDWNESIGRDFPHPESAVRQMESRAHMHPAGGTKAHLDEMFVRRAPYLKIPVWRYISVPLKAMDHPVLYVVLEVDPL